ncbi:hypothetical protein JAAARDRAFT_362604 [Jaapia argillacea MUCL 33604]|uniref:tRNA-dihydrouridine(16/17) synthase [NAD(P)(+)] n=1 Tax=Jaapia argillacea MUCL 33604 TaxID=933084 RepID=A0A067QHL6_9AGAM|nr:hypothetical protein JAAARDRAFT_362604 [Jaapia argillacea MUCL 33604]
MGLTATTESHSPSSDQPLKQKLGGYEFYRQVLGSPKFIVAPMVDQSELAFRTLCRRYGAQLVYTPMINAKLFATDPRHRRHAFNMIHGEEGSPLFHPRLSSSSSSSASSPSPAPSIPSTDRPLIVQFSANDPQYLLAAAKIVEPYCDAVDINLGCPQDIAKKGRYGSWLQDEWDLIYQMINILHLNLNIPVTAKFRIFPSIEKSVEYAKMLERAGAQMVVCHGRTREQRGHNTGLASYPHIVAIKNALSIPVIANGNILFYEDLEACLKETGADGVMCAEGVLYNPALFAPAQGSSALSTTATTPTSPSPSTLPLTTLAGHHPPHTSLAFEYLSIVLSQRTPTPFSAIKGHLFKILRPAIVKHHDLRDRLGKVGIRRTKVVSGEKFEGPGEEDGVEREGGCYVRGLTRGERREERDGGEGWREGVEEYIRVVREFEKRMEIDQATYPHTISTHPDTNLRVLPHWLAQPYFRPPPLRDVAPQKPVVNPDLERRLEEFRRRQLGRVDDGVIKEGDHEVLGQADL